ncbi:hypothetical protein IG631_22453 [Alternaria alternata]|nr:hypothetical protein IG631_22453 [Alternaria alternata]
MRRSLKKRRTRIGLSENVACVSGRHPPLVAHLRSSEPSSYPMLYASSSMADHTQQEGSHQHNLRPASYCQTGCVEPKRNHAFAAIRVSRHPASHSRTQGQ